MPILLVVVLAALLSACAGLPDLERLETPHYQTGAAAGARFCASCHPDTYAEWSRHSRHAEASRSPSYRAARADILAHPVLGAFMSAKMCDTCHGDPQRGAGIDCESCHGVALSGQPIEVTHEKLYKPRLAKLRRKDFCAGCHQVAMPVSGLKLTTVHAEWQASPAAKRGETCQSCHMPKEDGAWAYHGFNSFTRNPQLYRGKLLLDGVRLDGDRLRVTLASRVDGHAIPAGGPTRVLALELVLRDAGGVVLERQTQRFFKHVSLLPLIGGVPFTLIDNTQLQAGEKRRLGFDLPQAVRDRARQAELTLRMYEVADKYEGDIEKAHWRSAPIATAKLALRPSR